MAQKKRSNPSARKPAVVIPALTPPRGSPFAGISKTGAPARETQIPHLTAQVQIAKARQERLTQGGLLTPGQRAQEQKAAKTLAKPEKRTPQTAPKRSARTTPSQSTPPLVLGAPPAALSAALPNSTPARTPRPPARRGAPVIAGRFGAVPATKPTPGIDWGGAVAALGHGVDAAARRSAYHQAKLSQSIAGVGVQGAVPKNFTIPIGDLVGTAAAATGKKAITKDELARLEAQGVDLKPSLFKRFTEMGLKNGWSEAELEGLSGSARIDKAFTKPASTPLRIAANFAGDIAQLGTIPAAGEGIVRETIAGHGGDVAKALGEGLYSQLPVVGKHPVGDMATAHPFQFFSQFAGAGKTAGAVAGLARGVKGGAATERVVEGISRGPVSRNAWDATGQLASDAIARRVPRVADRLRAKQIDDIVAIETNRHVAPWRETQRAYKIALDKVGDKRAAELTAYQGTGGKPEQLAAFYRAQGNKGQAKFFDRVAANTKTLSDHDKAFLEAHAPAAAKTTQGAIDIEKFGPTAAKFARYRLLIRSAAHQGDPEAQHILKLREDYLKGESPKAPAPSPAVQAKLATIESQAAKHEDEYGRLERIANVKPKRPPKGSGAPAQDAWRAELKKYNTRARTARAKMQVHRTQSDRLNAKAEEIRGGIRAKESDAEFDPQGAEQAVYAEAVDRFAANHIASGGAEPTFTELSQPLPLTPSPFKPGMGGPTGFKKARGKQKVETGATVESGDFLIDPKAPLLANIRMQRTHLADILHDVVARKVGRPVTAGDELKPGEVFVSDTNLSGLKRTVNDLEDNPVSAPDYEEHVSRQQGIFDRLKGVPTAGVQRVPRGEKGHALPIASWKRILDHTRPPSRTAYDRFLQQYQRVLVSYRPSTFLNNAVGSPILASTFGAGPKSYLKAFESGPNRDPGLAAPYLSGGGVAGGLAPNPRSKVGKGFDWARYQSQKAEDFSRRATYMHAVLPGADKRAKELGYADTPSYLRDVAKGAVDENRLQKGLDLAADALGNSLQPNTKFGRAAGRGILFHNWVAHMAKVILYTLPVKHPRRLTVLNDLAEYGDQYRQEHGVWPDWYAAYLPLFQHVERLGRAGVAQVFTKTYSTQGFNPFATLQQFSSPVSTNESLKSILLGIAAPPIQIAGKTIFDRPYDSKSATRFALGQTVRAIPGVSIVAPSDGKSPDSIPIFSEKDKALSSGKKRHGKTVPLPNDFRASARSQPGILGALGRWAIGGIYDIPAQGPVHAIEQKKHIGAVAKKARKG